MNIRDDNLKSPLLNCFYSLTDARLSLCLNIFWGEIVILSIAEGIREMHRCHHRTLLSITSVIVPSSHHCDGS